MPQNGSPSRLPKWIACLAVLAAAVGMVAAFRALPSPDVSWLLVVARRVLEGARYGSDVLEVNPPLIVWLYMLPALGATLTGISAYPLLVAGCIALAVACTGLSHRVLRPLVNGVWIAPLLFVSLLVLPGTEFGQREHIAAILCLPWVSVAAARASSRDPGRRVQVIAGLLGAIGFLLKPYFVFAWLFVEALLVARRGIRIFLRVETALLVGTAVMYAAAVLIFAPDYLALASLLGPWYSRYLSQGQLDAVLLVTGVVIFLVHRWRHGRHPVLGFFELASAGFLLGAAVQLKWWPYHLLPGVVYAIPCLVVPWLATSGRKARVGRVAAALLGAGVLALALVEAAGTLLDPENPARLADSAAPHVRDWLIDHAGGDTIMVFSSNIHSAYPALELAGVTSASRLPSLWPLLAAYYDPTHPSELVEIRPPHDRLPVESWLETIVLEDFQRSRPRYLLVVRYDPHARNAGGSTRLDYLAYFRADHRFASILDAYRPVAELPRYIVLERTEK